MTGKFTLDFVSLGWTLSGLSHGAVVNPEKWAFSTPDRALVSNSKTW
jgi:hypothetical protein